MATPKAGGFKLSLAGAKNKPGLKTPAEKPAKRPRLALGDDEPEDDNQKQEISGWDAAEGGAVKANGKKEEPKGPRVIPALPNRNWREEVRKKQLARSGVHPEQNGDNMEKMEEPKMAYGLTTFKKDAEEKDASTEPMDTTEDDTPKDDGLTEEQRLEKNALDALLHGKSTDETVIPMQSEEEAYQQDIREAPDAPTLEAYEATPIEGFGAALLRGMGWKDGEELGGDKKPAAKANEIKRRPALLGIGAKEEAAVGIELGEWGKGKKKVAMSYNPVTLRNKKTGEMVTEDELKARLEAQKMVDEKPSRSSKYDDEDDERRREKRKERKDRDRRDDDHDSERRRDRDRRDDRRREKDRDEEYSDRDRRRDKKKYRDEEYSDSDRRREKRRDRDRRDRSRSPDDDKRERRRDRDRKYRSRSPDGDDYRKEKRRDRDRRDRDRSRSRDSDDRRKRRRDYDYDDDRDEWKRRHKDDKYYRK